VKIENPISENYSHLRPSLLISLSKNAKDNLRFFESIRIFEVGRNFNLGKSGVEESRALGIALAGNQKDEY